MDDSLKTRQLARRKVIGKISSLKPLTLQSVTDLLAALLNQRWAGGNSMQVTQNPMLSLSTTLAHGLLICIPFTLFVLVTFSRWPRLWLHSLPPDIQRLAGPKTAAEQRQTRILLIPFLLILPGLSVASALLAAHAARVDLSFFGATLHIYGIWIVVHLWDLLIIDFGYALLMDPKRPPIAGTAGAKGYKDFRFHLRAFARAVPMSALFVLPSALIISFLA